MTKKCDTCRFFAPGDDRKNYPEGYCIRGEVFEQAYFAGKRLGPYDEYPPLHVAREICNKEADGHFVYFAGTQAASLPERAATGGAR